MVNTRDQYRHLALYQRVLIACLALFVGAGSVKANAQNQALYWLNTQSGDAVVWHLNGPSFAGSYDYLGHSIPTQWQIVGNGDFNSDGSTDFIWQNTQTGDVSYWLMNGTTIAGTGYIARNIPLAWKIVGAADFNGDNHLDLVWQNIQTGDVVVWYMNGFAWTGNYDYLGQGVPTQWRIVGVGDMNGDGQPDLIWSNIQTGDVSYWAMNRITVSSTGYIARNIPLAWTLVGVGDYNSNGKPDLVWQNTDTGDVTVWYMNGFQWPGAWDYIAHSVPLEWHIFGTNLKTAGQVVTRN